GHGTTWAIGDAGHVVGLAGAREPMPWRRARRRRALEATSAWSAVRPARHPDAPRIIQETSPDRLDGKLLPQPGDARTSVQAASRGHCDPGRDGPPQPISRPGTRSGRTGLPGRLGALRASPAWGDGLTLLG